MPKKKDDEQARKARAEQLRAQIHELVQPPDVAGTNDARVDKETANSDSSESEQRSPNESPRDFVQRRMQEIERAKGKKRSD